MNLIVKTILEAVLYVIVFTGITIGNLLLFAYLFNSVDLMIFSFFISLIEIVLIISYLFPIMFKEYIKHYYEKEEMKKHAQKKSKKTN